jgi:DNA-binding NtrC family response regulator
MPQSLAPFPKSVLVVEDDDLVMHVLCEILGETYEVFCAATAETACAMLIGDRIDVVLLDYRLRAGSGEAVAALASSANVPMVWMTGDPGAVLTLEGDAHIILSKPFSIEVVLAALAKVLSQKANRLERAT